MGAKTVLVTGGGGYVGSHACKALAETGHVPVVYDHLRTGHRWAVKWGPFEQGDILDGARLDEILRRHRPAGVMHFAALACVAESFADPAAYFQTNVTGTLILLEAMRRHGIANLVFSSTCAVYGLPGAGAITEDAARRPLNPYGSSKLVVELMLEHYRRAHGLRYVSLRYFNAAGADPGGAIGEHHDPETHLIPLVLDVALGKRAHVEIFGEDYETTDGTCIRDYIHVCDIAEAHVLALRHLDRNEAAVFNLGNSRGTSVREIIALAARMTGKDIAVRSAARRPGDAPALIADASKLRRELGWSAALSKPETILETAWNWHRRHHGVG
ncbi:MAG: UDP-glucose 4-epimerase GalE [Gammaproteobacteria bacterium]|nr:UDP-glucose 4-epimerase GalE [Gammaproteobacteria bacterium]